MDVEGDPMYSLSIGSQCPISKSIFFSGKKGSGEEMFTKNAADTAALV